MGLTVGGAPMSASQVANAKIAMSVARTAQAGSIASIALIYAAMGESNLEVAAGGGVWQSTPPAYNNGQDVAGQALGFLTGGVTFGNGGAIKLARISSDPVAIANAVENNAVYEHSGGNSSTFVPGTADSYGPHLGGTASGLAEAKAIVAAYGGNVLKGGVAGASSGGSGTVQDGSSTTTYPFSISGTGNPDEDYWTGCNRLAQEVNWYFFANGEYLYYLDGEEMIAQQPAAHIDRVRDASRFYQSQGQISLDNTAFNYVSDHKRRFRTQRRTKVALAQSPTEVTMEYVCGIDEIMGGDVVELSTFGPGDGGWIVAECRRSVHNVYSELTLVPALAPITEAAVAGTTGTAANPSATNPTSSSGSRSFSTGGAFSVKLTGTPRNRVVQVALAAIARQQSTHAYQYGQVRPYPASLFGPAPIVTDCSGFSIMCYHDAGTVDPNGTSFNGSGDTYTLMAGGVHVSQPQPGDLVFYNVPGDSQSAPNHVAVYIGNSEVANMGGVGDPTRQPVNLAQIVGIRSYL